VGRSQRRSSICNAPAFPTNRGCTNSILLKLCKKFRPGAPPQEKLLLVLDALSKIEIRILAFDEVNFTEAGTVAKQKHFLNALRYLANELRISIVCLGTEEMMRVIRTVPSVENRFLPAVLPRWQTDNEFRKLLASFEKIIPLKYPSNLQSSSTLTSKLLTRSEGTIGELKMLLTAAATDAMRDGTERITEEIIDGCNYMPPSARKQRPVSC
jgi:Bacterial TniB protein